MSAGVLAPPRGELRACWWWRRSGRGGWRASSMELVAGVTHELNTPLAAIRSAGQNLADGVVADARPGAALRRADRAGGAAPLGARRPGARVRGHRVGARRLRGPSRRRWPRPSRRRWPTAAGCSPRTASRSRPTIPADLPPVLGRPRRSAALVRNLVDNAVKYGGRGQAGSACGRAWSRDGRQVAAARRGPRPRHRAGGPAAPVRAVLPRPRRGRERQSRAAASA